MPRTPTHRGRKRARQDRVRLPRSLWFLFLLAAVAWFRVPGPTWGEEAAAVEKADFVGTWVGYSEAGYSFLRLTLEASGGGSIIVYSYVDRTTTRRQISAWSAAASGRLEIRFENGDAVSSFAQRSGVWWLDIELGGDVETLAMSNRARLYLEGEFRENLERSTPRP